MSSAITVGLNGSFTVSPPFDTIGDFNKTYTVTAIRNIKEMIASGEDPLNAIYIPAGLTQAEFDGDISNGVSIVGMVTSGDNWVQIPSNYIVGLPTKIGVEYKNTAIIVTLGGLPTTEDISALLSDITQRVQDTIGLTPQVDTTPTSDVYVVSEVDHTSYVNARNANIINKKSYRQLYQEQITLNGVLHNTINDFECFISNTDCIFPALDPMQDNFASLPCNFIPLDNPTLVEITYLSDLICES